MRSQAQQWPGPGSNPDACSAEEFGCESIGTTCAINFVMPYTCGIDGGGGTCRFTLTVCCYDCKNGTGDNKIVIKSIVPDPDGANCNGTPFDPDNCHFSQNDVWNAVDQGIENAINSGCLPCFLRADISPCGFPPFSGAFKKLIQYKAPCWAMVVENGVLVGFFPCEEEVTCTKTVRYCIDANGVLQSQVDVSQGTAYLCPPSNYFPKNHCVLTCY